jgi:hypothetical protein
VLVEALSPHLAKEEEVELIAYINKRFVVTTSAQGYFLTRLFTFSFTIHSSIERIIRSFLNTYKGISSPSPLYSYNN